MALGIAPTLDANPEILARPAGRAPATAGGDEGAGPGVPATWEVSRTTNALSTAQRPVRVARRRLVLLPATAPRDRAAGGPSGTGGAIPVTGRSMGTPA